MDLNVGLLFNIGEKMKYNFDDYDSIDYSKIKDWKDFNREWKKWFDKQMAFSNSLPKGIQVGKIFTIGVADGPVSPLTITFAYYEIVKINKTTIRIKNRKGLCPDGYMDRVLGHGGSFPKHIIERLVF